jgi:hypothetical protein
MKKMIFLFIIIASITLANENGELKDEFGFAVGANIGYGLTYKHALSNEVSIRVTGGYFHESDTTYSFGAEIDYSLKRNKYMDFFLSLGALHTYEENSYYDDYYYNDYGYDEYYNEHDTRGMIGFGISSYVGDVFSFSLEFHQVFEYSLRTSSDSEDRSEFNIYPMVGMTVGFLF